LGRTLRMFASDYINIISQADLNIKNNSTISKHTDRVCSISFEEVVTQLGDDIHQQCVTRYRRLLLDQFTTSRIYRTTCKFMTSLTQQVNAEKTSNASAIVIANASATATPAVNIPVLIPVPSPPKQPRPLNISSASSSTVAAATVAASSQKSGSVKDQISQQSKVVKPLRPSDQPKKRKSPLQQLASATSATNANAQAKAPEAPRTKKQRPLHELDDDVVLPNVGPRLSSSTDRVVQKETKLDNVISHAQLKASIPVESKKRSAESMSSYGGPARTASSLMKTIEAGAYRLPPSAVIDLSVDADEPSNASATDVAATKIKHTINLFRQISFKSYGKFYLFLETSSQAQAPKSRLPASSSSSSQESLNSISVNVQVLLTPNRWTYNHDKGIVRVVFDTRGCEDYKFPMKMSLSKPIIDFHKRLKGQFAIYADIEKFFNLRGNELHMDAMTDTFKALNIVPDSTITICPAGESPRRSLAVEKVPSSVISIASTSSTSSSPSSSSHLTATNTDSVMDEQVIGELNMDAGPATSSSAPAAVALSSSLGYDQVTSLSSVASIDSNAHADAGDMAMDLDQPPISITSKDVTMKEPDDNDMDESSEDLMSFSEGIVIEKSVVDEVLASSNQKLVHRIHTLCAEHKVTITKDPFIPGSIEVNGMRSDRRLMIIQGGSLEAIREVKHQIQSIIQIHITHPASLDAMELATTPAASVALVESSSSEPPVATHEVISSPNIVLSEGNLTTLNSMSAIHERRQPYHGINFGDFCLYVDNEKDPISVGKRYYLFRYDGPRSSNGSYYVNVKIFRKAYASLTQEELNDNTSYPATMVPFVSFNTSLKQLSSSIINLLDLNMRISEFRSVKDQQILPMKNYLHHYGLRIGSNLYLCPCPKN
jgi:hypothetical protein